MFAFVKVSEATKLKLLIWFLQNIKNAGNVYACGVILCSSINEQIDSYHEGALIELNTK